MEVKTMVLDGIEYVLIPKDTFEKSLGIPSTPKEQPVENKISDFEVPVETKPKEEIPEESVVIVDSTSSVKKAQGSIYGYAERLKVRKLNAEDVMVTRTNFQDMPETPEIARNDFKDKIAVLGSKAKWGFYGPGAEKDIG